jgi:hypothetical protein
VSFAVLSLLLVLVHRVLLSSEIIELLEVALGHGFTSALEGSLEMDSSKEFNGIIVLFLVLLFAFNHLGLSLRFIFNSLLNGFLLGTLAELSDISSTEAVSQLRKEVEGHISSDGSLH